MEISLSLTECSEFTLRDVLSPTDSSDDTDNSLERFALSLREKRSTDSTDFFNCELLIMNCEL